MAAVPSPRQLYTCSCSAARCLGRKGIVAKAHICKRDTPIQYKKAEEEDLPHRFCPTTTRPRRYLCINHLARERAHPASLGTILVSVWRRQRPLQELSTMPVTQTPLRLRRQELSGWPQYVRGAMPYKTTSKDAANTSTAASA